MNIVVFLDVWYVLLVLLKGNPPYRQFLPVAHRLKNTWNGGGGGWGKNTFTNFAHV